jgi:hypothetical protein
MHPSYYIPASDRIRHRRPYLHHIPERIHCLPPLRPQATESSTAALRAYSADQTTCRHVQLLRYFGESPNFDRCGGACDNCLCSGQNAGDRERDFGPEVRVLLMAVRQAGHGAPWSQLEPQLTGKGSNDPPPPGTAAALRASLRPRRSVAALRELLGSIVSAGFVSRSTRRTQGGPVQRAYEAYSLAAAGQAALAQGGALRLVVPVPAAVRLLEEQDAAKMEERQAALAKHGVLDKARRPCFFLTPCVFPCRAPIFLGGFWTTVPPATSRSTAGQSFYLRTLDRPCSRSRLCLPLPLLSSSRGRRP